MKVLHVFGGIRSFKIAKWQANKGLEIHKIVIEDEKPFRSYFKNIKMKLYKSDILTKLYEKVRKKKSSIIRPHLLLYPFYLTFIGRAIKESKPDIIHANRHTGTFLSILAKKIYRSKAKIVFDYQDPWMGEELKEKSIFRKVQAKLFYKFEKFIVRNSDLIITQGEEQTQMLKKRYKSLIKKINHTWNTADKDFFKAYKKERDNLRKKYNINGTAILYLGSIINSHGVKMIPKVANKIVKEFPKTKFVMMGVIRDEKLWNSIKQEIKSYGIGKYFIEIYPKSKGDIPKYISMCDVGLITHKKGSYISELGIPTKLFEYMSCGLAVVTSNLNHLTKFVIPEKAGVSFRPNDVGSLVSILKKLLKSPRKIQAFGKNSRNAVEKKFNWGGDMRKLLKEYKSLIERR